MSYIQFDIEERQILDAYEASEYQSDITTERKKFVQQVALNTFSKEKTIKIKIPEHDLVALQKRALEEGIPYQTLVVSILHKYISGSLYDAIAHKANSADVCLHLNDKIST